MRLPARRIVPTAAVLAVAVLAACPSPNDPEMALALAEFLESEGIAAAARVGEPIEVPFRAGVNQARMLRRSAAAFSERIAERGTDTDYALLVEILTNRDETWVGGVHFYLADPQGRIAELSLSNSHHERFKAVDPTDRHGGFEVAKGLLQDALGN